MLSMEIPGHPILHFEFLKVELKRQEWRRFIDSDNPVAAALLAKMGYNSKEKREVRFAYLRMLLRLQKKLDEARLALIMSVADMYFDPEKEQEEAILREFQQIYPEDGEALMELMPAWKRWAYEEGIEKGIEKAVLKMLDKGFTPEEVAETLELPTDSIRKLAAKE